MMARVVTVAVVLLASLLGASSYAQCPSVGRMLTRDYSHMDAVIVSIGMMCGGSSFETLFDGRSVVGTTASVKRLLYYYNLRKVYFIIPHPEEQCDAINAIDPRVICLGEQTVLEGNTTITELEHVCVKHFGDWTKPTAKAVVGSKNLGWYLQQFIKLGIARSIPALSEDFLIWDADNVLLGGNHEVMTADGKYVFAENGNGRYSSNGYNKVASKLLGFRTPETPAKLNWVTGHMVFNRKIVLEMLAHIEATYKVAKWTHAVCLAMDEVHTEKDPPVFSEYQTYGAWMQTRHPRLLRKPTVVIDLVRNPPTVMRQVDAGQCCIPDASICQLYSQFKRRHATFYVILEEHKWRYRDKVCKDGWTVPTTDGRRGAPPPALPAAAPAAAAGQVVLSSVAAAPVLFPVGGGPRQAGPAERAFVFLAMGDAVARDLPTAIAALLATNTTADVVVYTWRVSPRPQNRINNLCVRVIPLTDRQMTSCPHKVMRKGTLNHLQQYSCSKVPLLLSLHEYKRVIFVDADIMFMANIDHLFAVPLKGRGIAGAGNPANANELDDHGIVRHSLNGALMLIEPSAAHHAAFLEYIRGFHGRPSERGDQVLTKDYFEQRGRATFLPVTYNWGLWNAVFLAPEERGLLALSRRRPPMGVHFSGKYKPWLPETSVEHKLWVQHVAPKFRPFAEQYGCVWRFFQNVAAGAVSHGSPVCAPAVSALVQARWRDAVHGCFKPDLLADTTPYTDKYPYQLNLDLTVLG